MQSYTLKEALAVLESGNWCNIRCITADVKSGTGGQLLELPKVRLCRKYANVKPSHEKVSNPFSVRPRHHDHFTRNVEMPNKQIRKIHPPLITHINGVAVI
ncbi:hypothetical protein ACFOWM_03465 [Ferruginibacter yonginensis]|uniref:Uncharacterized protein n=1 Tax=Ferruginibacter yonginensis TaxID=1310416 RepID=A0ABV8QQA8_9BACT